MVLGRLLSYWVWVTFQGRAVKLRGCNSGLGVLVVCHDQSTEKMNDPRIQMGMILV